MSYVFRDVDFAHTEARNFLVENKTTLPTTAKEGQLVYIPDTKSLGLYTHDGWKLVGDIPGAAITPGSFRLYDDTDTYYTNISNGTLTANRTLTLPNGSCTLVAGTMVPTTTSITAGNGLTGGGTLAETRTITLGTPSTITASTTNSVTDTSHTHGISGFLPLTGGSLTGNVSMSSTTNLTVGAFTRLTSWANQLDGKAYVWHIHLDATGNAILGYTNDTGARSTVTLNHSHPYAPISYFDNTGTYQGLVGTSGYIRTPTNGIIPNVSGGSGNVGTSGWPFNSIYGNTIYEAGTALSSKYASRAISITAGNGLSGGGTLEATRTLTLGTPGTLTASTTNAVTSTSHTHSITGYLPLTGGTLTGNLNTVHHIIRQLVQSASTNLNTFVGAGYAGITTFFWNAANQPVTSGVLEVFYYNGAAFAPRGQGAAQVSLQRVTSWDGGGVWQRAYHDDDGTPYWSAWTKIGP